MIIKMTPPSDGEVIESENKGSNSDQKLKTIHVVAYTVAAVIVRQYSGWQIGLAPGFGAFMIGQVLTAFGCICHYLCLMEIWSAVPFSGGSYGLSRATLGFHLGFLDGCLEALVYIGHASLSATSLSLRIGAIFDTPPEQGMVWVLCFIVVALAICVQNSVRILRRWFMVFAVLCMIILLVYILGMLKFVNFAENASLHRAEPASNVDNWFQGGWEGWIVILPYTLQPYAGIRSFTLLTGMTENPKVTLPRATLISFSIIILINIVVVFVFASQPGGIAHTALRKVPPMTNGWKLIFDTEDNPKLSTQIASILQIPATFSRLFAYLIPASVMIHSMGNSNLMPSFMLVNHNKDWVRSAVWSAAAAMGFVVVYYYYPVIELFNLTVMATMITDCTFLYGYILLKTTYSTVPREFVSPFGMAGAIFAFCMYVLIFISAAFYQKDYFALKFFAGFFVILSIYYQLFAKKTQTLNEEEDHVFFKMHVRNFNMSKKNANRRKWLNFFDGKRQKIAAVNYEIQEDCDLSAGIAATDVAQSTQTTSQGKGYKTAPPPTPKRFQEGTEIAVEGGSNAAALKYNQLVSNDAAANEPLLVGGVDETRPTIDNNPGSFSEKESETNQVNDGGSGAAAVSA